VQDLTELIRGVCRSCLLANVQYYGHPNSFVRVYRTTLNPITVRRNKGYKNKGLDEITCMKINELVSY